jgi:ribosome-associated toxin RatA of RatAB toxin-antitoxin module
MQNVERSVLVGYTASQMYNLVNDVKSYPKFIPYCLTSSVLYESDVEMSANLKLCMAGGIRKAFTTHNKLSVDRSIEMSLVDGPFRHLRGGWYFESLSPSQCKIDFALKFEFNSRIAQMTLSPLFAQMSLSMLDLFQKRAHEIYGK